MLSSSIKDRKMSGGGSSKSDSEPVVLQKSVAHRLACDVRDLMKSPLDDEGIYYQHDQADLLKGYAMILGPKDTVYENGFYLFKFSFPTNYPYSPPTVSFVTHDGKTRFHPNYYRSGKVCVSLLNTWRGDAWTGTQTIRSVLLTLCSLFDGEPLLNEPGVRASHPDVPRYRNIISFKNIQWAVIRQIKGLFMEGEGIPVLDPWVIETFGDGMKDIFLRNYKNIQEKIDSNIGIDAIVTTRVYSLMQRVNWAPLKEELEELHEQLTNGKIE